MPSKETIERMADIMAAGLMAIVSDDDWRDADDLEHLQALAMRLSSRTATDEDWIEAAEQLSPA